MFPTLWLPIKDSNESSKHETLETLATKLEGKGHVWFYSARTPPTGMAFDLNKAKEIGLNISADLLDKADTNIVH